VVSFIYFFQFIKIISVSVYKQGVSYTALCGEILPILEIGGRHGHDRMVV